MSKEQEQDLQKVEDLQDLAEELDETELVDPGQLEGTGKNKKDPRLAQEELKEDHPRFKKIYGKLKEAERKNSEYDEKIRKIEDDSKVAKQAFQEHNQKLVEAIERLSRADRKEVKEHLSDTEEEISKLEEEMSLAFDEGEFGKGMKIQSKINKLMRQSVKSPDINEIIKKVKDEVTVEVEAKTMGNATFQAWRKDNPWYDEDEVARAAADRLGVDIAKEGLPYDEVLEKVSKLITKRFGFDKKETRAKLRSVPTVDSGDNFRSSKGSRQLTEDEKRVANIFGMSEEDMLKQVLMTERGKANAR